MASLALNGVKSEPITAAAVVPPPVPFAALKYAIGECNYGGRVTDDKDRRLLNTLLDQIYCPAILGTNFKLSASGTYYVPEEGEDIAYYTNYINSLPIVPMPE
eukprot:scaffold3899_cov41-Prasinocladus_malaysianus.AAC.1